MMVLVVIVCLHRSKYYIVFMPSGINIGNGSIHGVLKVLDQETILSKQTKPFVHQYQTGNGSWVQLGWHGRTAVSRSEASVNVPDDVSSTVVKYFDAFYDRKSLEKYPRKQVISCTCTVVEFAGLFHRPILLDPRVAIHGKASFRVNGIGLSEVFLKGLLLFHLVYIQHVLSQKRESNDAHIMKKIQYLWQ